MKSGLIVLLSVTSFIFSYPQTALFTELFDDAHVASREWYDNTNVVISTTEHIAGSAGSAEYHWLKGGTAPTTGGSMRKLFTPTDSVYVDFWIKYSANYTGSNQPYHPHEFLILTTQNDEWSGPAFTHLTAYVEQNEGTPLLGVQDGMNIDASKLNTDLTNVTENRAVCGCNGIRAEEQATYVDCYKVEDNVYWNGKAWKADRIYFQDIAGPYYQNNWHHITAYFKLNTVSDSKGNPDGVIRYWYDDQLIIERTNVILRTGQHPTMQFNQFMIAPWIGDGAPVDQTFWVDNLTVSTGLITSEVPNRKFSEEMVSLYPNPSSGYTIIDLKSINKSSNDKLSFYLYNTLGKKVSASSNISVDRLVFEKKELENGVYIYQIKLNQEVIGSGKMVIL